MLLWSSIDASQRSVTIGAAPDVFTVSRPPIVSTSTACFNRPCPMAAEESRSSAGWATAAATTTSGIMTSGTNTSGPPIIAMTTRVMTMKGTSTIAVRVAEAKKSRSVSSSRITAARAPVDPRFWSSRRAISLANTLSPTSRSMRAPATSTK
jgi:hypothetical protein